MFGLLQLKITSASGMSRFETAASAGSAREKRNVGANMLVNVTKKETCFIKSPVWRNLTTRSIPGFSTYIKGQSMRYRALEACSGRKCGGMAALGHHKAMERKVVDVVEMARRKFDYLLQSVTIQQDKEVYFSLDQPNDVYRRMTAQYITLN